MNSILKYIQIEIVFFFWQKEKVGLQSAFQYSKHQNTFTFHIYIHQRRMILTFNVIFASNQVRLNMNVAAGMAGDIWSAVVVSPH